MLGRRPWCRTATFPAALQHAPPRHPLSLDVSTWRSGGPTATATVHAAGHSAVSLAPTDVASGALAFQDGTGHSTGNLASRMEHHCAGARICSCRPFACGMRVRGAPPNLGIHMHERPPVTSMRALPPRHLRVPVFSPASQWHTLSYRRLLHQAASRILRSMQPPPSRSSQ